MQTAKPPVSVLSFERAEEILFIQGGDIVYPRSDICVADTVYIALINTYTMHIYRGELSYILPGKEVCGICIIICRRLTV